MLLANSLTQPSFYHNSTPNCLQDLPMTENLYPGQITFQFFWETAASCLQKQSKYNHWTHQQKKLICTDGFTKPAFMDAFPKTDLMLL